MNYQDMVGMIEDNKHLISMVPVSAVLRFGYEAGLGQDSRVLDLGCGYGTVLKVWSQAFGISGVGVDLSPDHIKVGTERLKQSGAAHRIRLIEGDALKYADSEKYDMVICSETFGSIQSTLALGQKFLKAGGMLAYHKLYAKVQNPPQALIDFDGEVLTLSELNRIFNALGYYLTSMASDTDGMWEHYVVNWSGKRDIDRLRRHPGDKHIRQWIDKWYGMYFDYRRPYEGQALFGLERL